MSISNELVIEHTKKWINEVVIALNLCPFAARVVLENRVDYSVESSDDLEQHLHRLADCLAKLDETSSIETSLLIFPQAYKNFDDYLELLHLANLLLEDLNYTGVYQLASFHPEYLFAASEDHDASNFTNRSPYPMLHLLRESSIEKAIAHYDHIDDIPQNNITRLRQIGYPAMQKMLQNITQQEP